MHFVHFHCSFIQSNTQTLGVTDSACHTNWKKWNKERVFPLSFFFFSFSRTGLYYNYLQYKNKTFPARGVVDKCELQQEPHNTNSWFLGFLQCSFREDLLRKHKRPPIISLWSVQKNSTGHLTPTKVPRIKRKDVRKASTFGFRIRNPRKVVTLRNSSVKLTFIRIKKGNLQ